MSRGKVLRQVRECGEKTSGCEVEVESMKARKGPASVLEADPEPVSLAHRGVFGRMFYHSAKPTEFDEPGQTPSPATPCGMENPAGFLGVPVPVHGGVPLQSGHFPLHLGCWSGGVGSCSWGCPDSGQ